MPLFSFQARPATLSPRHPSPVCNGYKAVRERAAARNWKSTRVWSASAHPMLEGLRVPVVRVSMSCTFADDVRDPPAAYSVIRTCKLLGVSPDAYVCRVLPKLVAATNGTATGLLPHDFARLHHKSSMFPESRCASQLGAFKVLYRARVLSMNAGLMSIPTTRSKTGEVSRSNPLPPAHPITARDRG